MLTFLQLIAIGFSFGIAGQCLFVCTPLLATYILSKHENRMQMFRDVCTFLFARLAAYLVLGAVAGFSGALVQRWAASHAASSLHIISGILIIALAILSLFAITPHACVCSRTTHLTQRGSLILLGFCMGIVPCAPLIALLFEIALISKSMLHGVLYALCFGIGTVCSGLLVIAAISGVVHWFPRMLTVLQAQKTQLMFRITCAVLLVAFGVLFMLK